MELVSIIRPVYLVSKYNFMVANATGV